MWEADGFCTRVRFCGAVDKISVKFDTLCGYEQHRTDDCRFDQRLIL